VEIAHTHLAWGLLQRDRGDMTTALDHLQAAAEQFEAAGLAKQAQEARRAAGAGGFKEAR